MHVTVQQLTFIEWPFLAMYLGGNIPGTQVQDKQSLQFDASLLDGTGDNNQTYGNDTDSNHDGTGETTQVMTDIEDESHRDNRTYQDGEEQGQVVDITLCP